MCILSLGCTFLEWRPWRFPKNESKFPTIAPILRKPYKSYIFQFHYDINILFSTALGRQNLTAVEASQRKLQNEVSHCMFGVSKRDAAHSLSLELFSLVTALRVVTSCSDPVVIARVCSAVEAFVPPSTLVGYFFGFSSWWFLKKFALEVSHHEQSPHTAGKHG